MLNYDDISVQWANFPDPDEAVSAPQLLVLVSYNIEVHAARLRRQFLNPVSAYEAASWPLKIAEAKAGGGPMLQAEADARGVTLAEIVSKVLGKASVLAGLEAAIAGNSGRHRDALAQLTTREDILAYDWRDGWPE